VSEFKESWRLLQNEFDYKIKNVHAVLNMCISLSLAQKTRCVSRLSSALLCSQTARIVHNRRFSGFFEAVLSATAAVHD
jgi:hypothetical protein